MDVGMRSSEGDSCTALQPPLLLPRTWVSCLDPDVSFYPAIEILSCPSHQHCPRRGLETKVTINNQEGGKETTELNKQHGSLRKQCRTQHRALKGCRGFGAS